MDLASYRTRAEAFLAELHEAYYRHDAGLDADVPLEQVYARHDDLFTRDAVDALRETSAPALLEFAVSGHLERATAAVDAERARREATLRIDVAGEALGFREAAIAQAAAADPARREAIEQSRLAATEHHLNPLAHEGLQTTHALSRELGWPSHRAMWVELKGLDLDDLVAQARDFLAATEDALERVVEPELQRTLGYGLADWRRADLPFFFRVPEADALFPPDRLVGSLRTAAANLGLALGDRPGIALDVESRPGKSPRAFCAPVRVPADVRLVMPPVGGAEDYAALFHEGGHALHFGTMDAGQSFERRCLGDNAVTEAFAFLFEHVVDDPAWLAEALGVAQPGPHVAHQRARRLLYLRRYCAKLAYESALHGADDLTGLDAVYARELSSALRVNWPATTWLTDVDPGFYSASYLRAWAIEAGLRRRLTVAHGPAWWAAPAAGAEIALLMGPGQPHVAEELLGDGVALAALLPDVS
ncbi:MAG TPA: hypothetical protein VGI54_05850 [Solirubrobacteraceae bacterium]